MATAEAVVLRVLRAGRLAHLLQRQAHFHLWKDAAPMSSKLAGCCGNISRSNGFGAVRADLMRAQPV